MNDNTTAPLGTNHDGRCTCGQTGRLGMVYPDGTHLHYGKTSRVPSEQIMACAPGNDGAPTCQGDGSMCAYDQLSQQSYCKTRAEDERRERYTDAMESVLGPNPDESDVYVVRLVVDAVIRVADQELADQAETYLRRLRDLEDSM